VVPGQHRALHNAVPHQHAAFEHFAQTGAALHPALCKFCAEACEEWAWWVGIGFFSLGGFGIDEQWRKFVFRA
jgi:hypothetical protein